MESTENSRRAYATAPDAAGYFGPFGGQYVPEILMPALGELEHAYRDAADDLEFREELAGLLRDYVG